MKGLGVEINLSKSILSTDSLALEFAKKTIYKGQDVSPVPIREYCTALETSAGFVAFSKKYALPESTIKRLLGLGYKSSTSMRMKLFALLLKIPGT